MKNILFIYNPNSGKGKILRKAEQICDILKETGNQVDVYCTKGPLDAQNKVMYDAGGYDLVVCGGGDGTLSEVVSGMLDGNLSVPIGFIPAGSTNDTRPGFGLPRDILDAARLCLNGVPFRTDVGRINNEFFTYVASFGSLSAVSCFTPQDMKRIFGHGAYLIEGIKQLLKMESYQIQVCFDDQEIEGDFFLGMVTNSLSVGGFEGITGGLVDLQDGLFEVALLKRPRNFLDFSREVDLMLVHNREEREILDDVVVKFRTDKVTFRSDSPIQWVRDGENGGKHKEAVIEVCNKAVTIMSSSRGD